MSYSSSSRRLTHIVGLPRRTNNIQLGLLRDGGEVAKMALGTDRIRRIINAAHALRDRYAEHVRVDELASIAQLSPSAFHRQFKALTAMTPLQYQKQLRLFEARRLLASGETNVETTAFRVGYESPSQFSREYTRMSVLHRRRIRRWQGSSRVPASLSALPRIALRCSR